MRVLLTTPTWPPEASANGIVTYVGSIREGLKQLGVDARVVSGRIEGARSDPGVTLVPPRRSPPLMSEQRARRLRVRLLGSDSLRIDSARRLAQTVKSMAPDFRPDLIEMEESFGLATEVSKRLDAAIVLRLHGPWFLNGDALGVVKDESYEARVKLEGEAIANAHSITSPSADLLGRVRRYYGLALPDAVVIPNPAPPADPDSRWTLAECDPNLVVYVGRFDRHKGGDLAIDAFSAIAEDRPELRLAFIGPDRGLRDEDGTDVSLAEYLTTRVPNASVRSRIENLGQLRPDEVTRWRKNARAVVVASRYEVFGMVVVEALVQGCPLVAADSGGIPEIVRDGVNGLLFRSSDASDLAGRLETLLDDAALSERLGAEGSRDIPERFGIDAVARRTKDYYEQVLAAG